MYKRNEIETTHIDSKICEIKEIPNIATIKAMW